MRPLYYANAAVSITASNERPPWSATANSDVNGLIEAGGPSLITNLAVIAGNDVGFKQKVTALGGQPGFAVKNFPTPPGTQVPLPLIMIEMTSGDQASADKTMQIASTQMDSVVRDVQRSAGVAESQMARAIVVSPAKSVLAMPSRTKASAGLFFGGLGLAVVASVIADFVANRLQRNNTRRSPHPHESAESLEGVEFQTTE